MSGACKMKKSLIMAVCLPALVVFVGGCGKDRPDMSWVRIETAGFTGEMGRYPVTNKQYARFLNDALESRDIEVHNNVVRGTSGSFARRDLYRLDGPGWSGAGAVNGGKSRISHRGGRFDVEDGFENHPVTYVSWYGASAFADFYGWRLPTESEWNAVAGYTDGRRHATGDSLRDGEDFLANYLENDSHPYAEYGTTPVGFFGYFGYGLADMEGNVWEWTASLRPGSDSEYVFCGGGWSTDNESYSIDELTDFSPPGLMEFNLGFRVCR